jgi:hypothetical protein
MRAPVYPPTHARCSGCGVMAPAHTVQILRGSPAGRTRGIAAAWLCPPCYAAWWAAEEQAALMIERYGRPGGARRGRW